MEEFKVTVNDVIREVQEGHKLVVQANPILKDGWDVVEKNANVTGEGLKDQVLMTCYDFQLASFLSIILSETHIMDKFLNLTLEQLLVNIDNDVMEDGDTGFNMQMSLREYANNLYEDSDMSPEQRHYTDLYSIGIMSMFNELTLREFLLKLDAKDVEKYPEKYLNKTIKEYLLEIPRSEVDVETVKKELDRQITDLKEDIGKELEKWTPSMTPFEKGDLVVINGDEYNTIHIIEEVNHDTLVYYYKLSNAIESYNHDELTKIVMVY